MSDAMPRPDPERARSLRRYIRIGQTTGGFVLLLGMALLIHGAGWSTRPLPYAAFGGVIAVTGFVFIRYFHRSATRLQWIFRFGVPFAMRVSVRMADSGEFEAQLFEDDAQSGGRVVRYVVPIQTPDATAATEGEPLACAVYPDPESGLPAVIRTEDAVYWVRG